MDIHGILDFMQYQSDPVAGNTNTASASFGDMLSAESAAAAQTVTGDDDMSPEQKAQQAEFERLMRTVDYVIEEQRKQAEVAREEAEKRKMERILEEKEFAHDMLLKQADEKRLLEKRI